MKKLFMAAALCLALCFAPLAAACSGGDSGEDSGDNSAYVYEGEEFSFSKAGTAYGSEEYAQGKVFEYEGYTSEVHWIKNKGNNIFMLLSLPEGYDGEEKLPAIVCCHGFNSRHTEYDDYLHYFAEAGFATITFDFRGGSLTGCLSDGDIREMTIDTEISDVKAVTDYVSGLDCIDNQNMMLVGHSQGGLIASLAAADEELSNKFNGLLLLAPGFEIVEQNASRYYGGETPVPSVTQFLGVTLNKGYVYSLLAHYDVYEEAAAFRNPVKIFLGTTDGLFTEDAMQLAVDAYGSNASYSMVEGGAHNFLTPVLERIMPSQIMPFISDCIG